MHKNSGVVIFLVTLILILGAALRFTYRNWDQSNHLHPDERFLTMVAMDMRFPEKWSEYLNPQLSTVNPNNVGYTFFVYGAFPIVVSKWLAQFFMMHSYEFLNLLGRSIAATLDMGVLICVTVLSWLFVRKYRLSHWLVLFAPLCYALSVLPIQLSRFFTTDPFANFFSILSFTLAVVVSLSKKKWLTALAVCLSAGAFGLAVASKVSAVYIAPLIGFFLIERQLLLTIPKLKKLAVKGLFQVILIGAVFGVVSYLTLRIANPSYFQESSFFDPSLNQNFQANLKQLKGFNTPDGWYPPGVQWISKTPILFPLKNIFLVGLGMPLSIFTVLGCLLLLCLIWQKKIARLSLLVTLLWVVGVFAYLGSQFVTTMRYFWILYPFFSVFAGLSLSSLFQMKMKKIPFQVVVGVKLFMIASLFVWPAMFMSIYQYDHSRVQASRWMLKNIPEDTVVAFEHWDDGLPITGGIIDTPILSYQTVSLPVFYPDTSEKWHEMSEGLEKAEYYILTSNRGWGSIMAAPERYPLMTQFYQDLFAGRSEFEKIADFTSYPSLVYLGIPVTFPTDSVEEAFSVYDHPRVMVFQKITP